MNALKSSPPKPVVQPLNQHVRENLDEYFKGCNPPTDLYRMVLEQVEKPLLERVLDFSGGNQSRAAEVLGINRGTLRKKLKHYSLD